MTFRDTIMTAWHRTTGPLVLSLALALAWSSGTAAQPPDSADPTRIIELETELQRQRAIQADLRRELARLQADQSAAAAGPLAESIMTLRAELSALSDRNSNRAELDSANQRLTELNAQLRQEMETLALEMQTLRSAQARSWLLYGAGLLLAGLLTGVAIKSRPRRSAWS
jgi:SH3 domain protein